MPLGLERVRRLIWSLAWLGFASGCGVVEYDAKIDARLAELNKAKPFEVLYQLPIELTDPAVKIRVPGLSGEDTKRFKAYDLHSPDPEAPDKRIPEQRILPGFFLPGYKMTLEAPASADDPLPLVAPKVYLYLCAVPKKDPNYADLEKGLLNNLKAIVSNVTPWKEVKVPTPTGAQKTWRKLRGEGKMFFAYLQQEAGISVAHDEGGVIEFWIYEEENIPVKALVGWRIPKRFEEKFKLTELAELTAGTIQIDPIPE
jgi:hypothetical protein